MGWEGWLASWMIGRFDWLGDFFFPNPSLFSRLGPPTCRPPVAAGQLYREDPLVYYARAPGGGGSDNAP